MPRTLANETVSTNLVKNPSFELANTNWQNDQGARSNSSSFSGSWSNTFIATSSFGNFYETDAGMDVIPHEWYTASFYYKMTVNSGSAPHISINVDSNFGTSLSDEGLVATTNWKRYTVTVNVGQHTKAFFRIYNNNGNVSGFFDAFQFERGKTATPYFDGSSGNGYSWTGTAHNSTSQRNVRNIAKSRSLATSRSLANTVLRKNFVTNPSFEIDVAGNGIIPSLWTSYGVGGLTYKGVASDWSAYGSNSFKISAASITDTGIRVIATGLTIGADVTLSAWVKTDGTVGSSNLTLDTSQNGVGGAKTNSKITGANSNQRQSTTMTAIDRTSVNIFLGLGSFGATSAGTVQYDGIMLEQAFNPTSYFDGFSQGCNWTGTPYLSTSIRNKRYFAT